MQVCIYVVCMYLCIYVFVDVSMHLFVYIRMYMYGSVYVRMYVNIYARVYVCMYLCIHIGMHTCVYVRMYVGMQWNWQIHAHMWIFYSAHKVKCVIHVKPHKAVYEFLTNLHGRVLGLYANDCESEFSRALLPTLDKCFDGSTAGTCLAPRYQIHSPWAPNKCNNWANKNHTRQWFRLGPFDVYGVRP